MPLHFTQSCPTCGRRLEIPTRLLGQTVACQHCLAEFHSHSDDDTNPPWTDPTAALLARVDAALQRSQPKASVN